jgi:hypothetical protein
MIVVFLMAWVFMLMLLPSLVFVALKWVFNSNVVPAAEWVYIYRIVPKFFVCHDSRMSGIQHFSLLDEDAVELMLVVVSLL